MTITEEWSSITIINKAEDSTWFTLRLDCTKEMEKAGEQKCKDQFERLVFEMRRVIDDRFGLIKKEK